MPRRPHGQQGPKSGRELLKLPTLPPPQAVRAVSICIPDDPTWRALFWGHVQALGSWLQYERDPDKRGKPTADVWREIISEAIAVGEDEVTDCMAVKIREAVCEAVALCLEPLMAARHAELLAALAAIDGRTITIGDYVISIGDTINSSSITRNTYNTHPPTQAERSGAQPIAETRALQASGISLEQFYGACISIVEGLVEAMTDYFERLEAISNALELTIIIAESVPLPIVSDVAEAAAGAAKLVDFIQETAMEMFAAADTVARRLNLADKLYCKGRHVRALDMNMIAEALAEAWIGDLIDWDDPIGSLARIATGEFAPEQVFYLSLGVGLAVWTVTGDFEGLITRATWRYWVNRGKNNPQSPVPDCGDEEDDDTLYVIVRCATNVTVNSAQAESLGGNVWRFVPPSPGTTITIESSVPPNVNWFRDNTLGDASYFNQVTMWYYSDLRTVTPPGSYASLQNVWYVQPTYTNGTSAESPPQDGRPINALAYPYNNQYGGPIVAIFTW